MKTRVWLVVPFLIFLLLIAFLWRGLALDPHLLPSTQLNKPLPAFDLKPLHAIQPQFTPRLFKGHISILNVWASWCAACQEEQVFLLRLAREGVVIYGLNYKDKADIARRWLIEWGNPYQNIGQDNVGKVAMELGVYGAPETFLIDKVGRIRYRHVGILTPDVWNTHFVSRIQQLEIK